MPIPSALLSRLGQLEGPIAGVRNSIDSALVASHNAQSSLLVGGALDAVERAAEVWLNATGEIEGELAAHVERTPDDNEEVQGRLGGLGLLHLAVASDLAILSPCDDVAGGQPIRSLGSVALAAEHAETIQAAAFGEGGLIYALSGASDVDDNDLDTVVREEIDEVVSDLIERAGRSASATLIGLAGGTNRVLADLNPYFHQVAAALPQSLHEVLIDAAKRVRRLVKEVLSRADRLFAGIMGQYRQAVAAITTAADPESLITESLSGRVLGRIFHASDIRAEASRALDAQPRRGRIFRRLRRLKKTHRKWVGPVRFVAQGLPHLWTVPVGPIPAAPVAAVALLCWTVFVTGDQLDARGPFPDIWKGVIRIANGQ